jgi:hypothetical protein
MSRLSHLRAPSVGLGRPVPESGVTIPVSGAGWTRPDWRRALRASSVAAVLIALAATCADAQSSVPAPPKDDDHVIVYEVGWAGDYSGAEGFHPKGATFAIEVTPLPDRLELEVGITAIRANDVTETSVDVLFKKPWRLSERIEFMAGIGPEVIHATGAEAGTFLGLSVVGDLMFWSKKNVGWYLEPGYEIAFRAGTIRQGFAIAGGFIIGRSSQG